MQAQYIVVSCIAGELSFYRGTGLGIFHCLTGRKEEAVRLTWAQAMILQNRCTFAINESHLDAWLADPPADVKAILARQKESMVKVQAQNQPA